MQRQFGLAVLSIIIRPNTNGLMTRHSISRDGSMVRILANSKICKKDCDAFNIMLQFLDNTDAQQRGSDLDRPNIAWQDAVQCSGLIRLYAARFRSSSF